jgi:hypothetical protein
MDNRNMIEPELSPEGIVVRGVLLDAKLCVVLSCP